MVSLLLAATASASPGPVDGGPDSAFTDQQARRESADAGMIENAWPRSNPLSPEESSTAASVTAPPDEEMIAIDEPVTAVSESPAPFSGTKWYERLSLRGYTQVRYNRLGETNAQLMNRQGDRSIGDNGGFLIRRARLVISGDVSDHVYVYLQPDFASFIGDTGHVGLMRDWYADIAMDPNKEFRLRVGQSKVPYGFENLQSSSRRLPLDRADPLNSALKDERDIGVSFMWTPKEIKSRFKHLASSTLRGTGDYGVFSFAVFNGQNANRAERNDTPHLAARLAWPFDIGGQFFEVGVSGFAGWYVGKMDDFVEGRFENFDSRGAVSLVLYPQPFGVQAEYNVGVGPALRDDAIEQRFLHGGYVLLSMHLGSFFPFVRGSYYEGSLKHETNSPPSSVREVELGVEWQIMKALELTAAWNIAERTEPVAPYSQESGMFGRLQLQVNY